MTFSLPISSPPSRGVMLFCLFFGLSGLIRAQTKTLGLTRKLNGNDENGYILYTPIATDTTFLMNKCGQRLHSWRSQYTPGLSVYLKPNGNLLKTGTYTDTIFGFAGGRGGIIEEFDWDNNLVWRYKLFNDSLCQHHDITPMPNGNILVLAWHSISKSKALTLGRSPASFANGQNELWGERIIELKPLGKDSAEIVWQWDLYDHIVQDRDTNLANYGIVGIHPELLNINYALTLQTSDWIHANGLDYNEELDQIVVSCHNVSEIWIIDHSTTSSEARTHLGGKFNKGGDFLYRWGNPAAYDMGTSKDRKLFRQHNAHWIPRGFTDSGSIMVFNNGWNRDTAYSTVEVIRTPILSNGSYISTLPYGPGNSSWTYKDSIPTRFYSQIISGAQRLPNGNTLVCSGVQGRFFEVTPAGKTLWEYKNPVNSAEIQSDGQTPKNNQVFRCTYYPKNYSAFNNRKLVSSGTIEKNSYIYSCNYETVKPKTVALSPKKNDTAISIHQVLTVTTDEAVLQKGGNISIFNGNVLLESVAVQSDMVRINNNVISIYHAKPFPVNSRISVAVSANSFRDSSNNLLSKSIDTSEWSFNTIRAFPDLVSLSPAHQTLNHKTSETLLMEFSEMVVKNTGNITLYENGVVKEIIPVSSSRVEINGHKVKITPSTPWKVNTLVVITMDSCFRDTFGLRSYPIVFGDWYFRTTDRPKIVSINPALNAKDVSASQDLVVEFDKDLTVTDTGSIMIYENNQVFETIPANDIRITLNGKFLNINPAGTFGSLSRIAISVPANVLMDTFGLYSTGIDSSNWHFISAALSSVSTLSGSNVIQVYPNPSKGKLMLEMNSELQQVQLFDLTGKNIRLSTAKLSDKVYEIEATGIAKGHYMLLVNGLYRLMIEVDQ
jgi:hypothetical protein